MLDTFALDESVAVVTGGSRGIGEAIAVSLAEAGADVAVAARSEEALEATVDRIEGTDSEGIAYPLDVTDSVAIEAMFDHVEDELGPVDTLVNNAGVNPFFGDARDLSHEMYQKIFSVNVEASFYCAQNFGRRVFDRDGTGTLLNIASVGGVIALPNQAPYTASKHAMVGLTKTLAVDWAPSIRVNALAPGYVKTESTEGVRNNENIRKEILDTIPENRFAEPEEIASAAVYLVSDAAGYATGEVHVVDGGIAAQ
jgi:NAD(P)-dependent dehydrogenase (short-subunit alcohol dehydrogenase family)